MKENLVIRNYGTYDVNKLLALTKNLPIKVFRTKSLQSMLKARLWEENNKIITPDEVIKNPKVSPTHASRIDKSDLYFPILVYKDRSNPTYLKQHRKDKVNIKIPAGYDIIDGLHRLSYAVKNKIPYVNVRIVSWNLLQKARTNEYEFS